MAKSFKNFGERIRNGEMLQSINEQTEAALDAEPVLETPHQEVKKEEPTIIQAPVATKGVVVDLPVDLHQRLSILTYKTGMTRKQLAVEAIKKYVEELEKK